MKFIEFVIRHPLGVLAFIFAVAASVVGSYVYNFLHQDKGTGNIVTINAPVVSITEVPSQGGGPDSRGVIAGKIEGIQDPNAYRVVVYALTDHWYVQPTRDEPLTLINNDGTWATETHLGTSYAVILVDRSFVPQPQPSAIPRRKSVIAQVTVGAHISP